MREPNQVEDHRLHTMLEGGIAQQKSAKGGLPNQVH